MTSTVDAQRGARCGLLCLAVIPTLVALAGCAPASDDRAESAGTDVFVVELRTRDGVWEASPPLRVSDRAGYDNQPAFSADGSVVWYVSRAGLQADIYGFDLRERRTQRITRTLESEYSPSAIPGQERFSVVRVERDGRQRLWAFDGAGELPELLLAQPEYVAYHAWVDERTVVVTALGEPSTLHTVTLGGEISDTLASDVGRSLQRVPGKRAVSFVQLGGEEPWIHELDVDSGQHRPLTAALPGTGDHAWLPDGELVMAQGASLFHMGPGTLGLWTELADYSERDIRGITRLAISTDGRFLSFVAEH